MWKSLDSVGQIEVRTHFKPKPAASNVISWYAPVISKLDTCLRFDEFAELQAKWTCWDDGSKVVVGPCDGELHHASLKSKFCPSITQAQRHSLSLLGSLVPCLLQKEIECWCSCWINASSVQGPWACDYKTAQWIDHLTKCKVSSL